jgi:hypothetical protein
MQPLISSSHIASSNYNWSSVDGQGVRFLCVEYDSESHWNFTQASISTTIYSPQNSNIIYEQRLGLKKRGFPLWIPEPNRQLPMPYQRRGVDIGDVGIITPSGGFSFLFNICLPRDSPLNPDDLPEEFSPIHPPIRPADIREFLEFKPHSYLVSAAIEKVDNNPPFM